MAADPLCTDDAPDDLFRPPWEDSPDETDADLQQGEPLVPCLGPEILRVGADPGLLATLAGCVVYAPPYRPYWHPYRYYYYP